jgi:quercetin dioxygenase-like cupin family protein
MIIVPGRAPEAKSISGGAGFDGDVWMDIVLGPTDGVMVNETTFMPGARTHWHEHEGGQVLRIVAGEGFVCVHGEQPMKVRAGDSVWSPPGERHWHGASPTAMLIHTATTFGETSWFESAIKQRTP